MIGRKAEDFAIFAIINSAESVSCLAMINLCIVRSWQLVEVLHSQSKVRSNI